MKYSRLLTKRSLFKIIQLQIQTEVQHVSSFGYGNKTRSFKAQTKMFDFHCSRHTPLYAGRACGGKIKLNELGRQKKHTRKAECLTVGKAPRAIFEPAPCFEGTFQGPFRQDLVSAPVVPHCGPPPRAAASLSNRTSDSADRHISPS